MLNHKKSQGFTLLELMVTVAIMAIMAAIALPNMRNFVANTRMVNRAEQIANLFRFAKGESIRMNVPVLICGVNIRSDGRPTGTCDSTKSDTAMMAYADQNRNGTYDSASDTVLRTITVNASGQPDSNKVRMEVKGCPISGSSCNTAIASNAFAYMPTGMFGYIKNASARINSYNALSNNINFGSAYIRFAVSDRGRNSNETTPRYIVVSPNGSVTICTKAGAAASTGSTSTSNSTKTSTVGETVSGAVAQICART